MTNEAVNEVANVLIRKGRALFDAPKVFHEFSGNIEADKLLNDLDGHPHAFLLACVMDKQVKAETAWLAPHRLRERLGTFKITDLGKLTRKRIVKLMAKPTPLHRFPEVMAEQLYLGIECVISEYGGDASRIWTGEPSSATVVYRLLQFQGIGPKIATMGANILAREFKVPFSDYFSIDISVDVHVRRVFRRLGLIRENATTDEVVYKTRSMHPEFPGMLDLPVWDIGRNWCKAGAPLCAECYMRETCPYEKEV